MCFAQQAQESSPKSEQGDSKRPFFKMLKENDHQTLFVPSTETIEFTFMILHPVSQKIIQRQQNFRSQAVRDLKRNLLVFNCDIFSFCSVPIYLCLIEVEYSFHGERNTCLLYTSDAADE